MGHRFGLLCYWMVCLGNEQGSSCCFWDCNQVLHFRLLLIIRSIWNFPALRANHTTFQGCTHSLQWPTLCLWSVPLNKFTSHLPLWLSLNSFCDETSRAWISLGPETRCDFIGKTMGLGEVWSPGVSDGQGSLVCCSPWGHKESDII